MNKGQYQRLCYLNDEVLKGVGNNSVGVAISWLHIIREHPDHLKNYEDIFESKVGFRIYLKYWKRYFRNLLTVIYVLIKSIIKNKSSLTNYKRLSKCDVLFISHLLNLSDHEKQNDNYFSKLPQMLAHDGYHSLTVMLNHSGFPSSHYPIVTTGNYSRLIFADTLDIASEIKNLMQLWQESKILKKNANSEQVIIKKKFYYRHPLKLFPQLACIL